jgi:hypothetical protein
MSDTDVARRQQGVAGPESRLCSSRELPVEGHVPAERVSQSNDHREQSSNMDRIDERVPAYTGGEDGLGVLRGQGLRPQRKLLQESECRAQRLLDRRRTPVTSDRLPDPLAERVRRDRAVGSRSERTLADRRDECCEELALANAPVGRAVHCQIERLGKGASEELGPVVERLQDVRWLRASLSPDQLEELRLLRIVAVLETSQPHGSTFSPASSRSRPAATATETVCSKMTSSE